MYKSQDSQLSGKVVVLGGGVGSSRTLSPDTPAQFNHHFHTVVSASQDGTKGASVVFNNNRPTLSTKTTPLSGSLFHRMMADQSILPEVHLGNPAR